MSYKEHLDVVMKSVANLLQRKEKQKEEMPDFPEALCLQEIEDLKLIGIDIRELKRLQRLLNSFSDELISINHYEVIRVNTLPLKTNTVLDF